MKTFIEILAVPETQTPPRFLTKPMLPSSSVYVIINSP